MKRRLPASSGGIARRLPTTLRLVWSMSDCGEYYKLYGDNGQLFAKVNRLRSTDPHNARNSGHYFLINNPMHQITGYRETIMESIRRVESERKNSQWWPDNVKISRREIEDEDRE